MGHHVRVPVTSHFFSDGPCELPADAVDDIAASLEAEFGDPPSTWPAVIRSVVRVLDPYISTATLWEVASLAEYLGEDPIAQWLDMLRDRPAVIEALVRDQLDNHAQFAALGPFVRRKASTRDGVEEGPGPWHGADCRFVARAGSVAAWEGVETLPDDGRLCRECNGGQPPGPAQLPPADRDRARDEIRDQIAALGTFVRRRADGDVPPGKWHAGGCWTTRTAAAVRSWEGASELPAGEDVCKTCLRA